MLKSSNELESNSANSEITHHRNWPNNRLSSSTLWPMLDAALIESPNDAHLVFARAEASLALGCAADALPDAERVVALGAREDRVRVTGNMKFDEAARLASSGERLDWAPAAGLDQGRWIVAGSTAAGEEELLLGAFQALLGSEPELRLALAPRRPERWDEVVRPNLDGVFFTTRAALRHLTDGGRIVNISSVLGRFGVPGYTAYCASKHGVIGLTKALAFELAPPDITVNAICPGWVDTDMATDGLQLMADGMGIDVDEANRSLGLG